MGFREDQQGIDVFSYRCSSSHVFRKIVTPHSFRAEHRRMEEIPEVLEIQVEQEDEEDYEQQYH